jgi:cystathionine beta-lyase
MSLPRSGQEPPAVDPLLFDAVTEDALRAGGGLKWTQYGAAIGAFVAEMDFGTAPVVSQALHEAVERGRLGYLTTAAAADMARACADWQFRRYGWTVPPEWITPLPDVIAGLQAAIEHFTRPGSPVVLPTPAYMPFRAIPGALGRQLIEVPMVEEQLALADVVEAAGARVFSDEIHAPLVLPGAEHRPYASLSPVTARHTVTATSASKAWNMPGLKAAQLILSDPGDVASWAAVGFLFTHGASTPGVLASTAAYDRGGAWLDGVLAYLDGNRRLLGELLAERLPGVRYTAPEGTYLAWLDCRGLGLEGSVGQFFLERAGVALVDGPECGAPGAGHVRLNFATPRDVLVRMVDRMAAAAAVH